MGRILATKISVTEEADDGSFSSSSSEDKGCVPKIVFLAKDTVNQTLFGFEDVVLKSSDKKAWQNEVRKWFQFSNCRVQWPVTARWKIEKHLPRCPNSAAQCAMFFSVSFSRMKHKISAAVRSSRTAISPAIFTTVKRSPHLAAKITSVLSCRVKFGAMITVVAWRLASGVSGVRKVEPRWSSRLAARFTTWQATPLRFNFTSLHISYIYPRTSASIRESDAVGFIDCLLIASFMLFANDLKENERSMPPTV